MILKSLLIYLALLSSFKVFCQNNESKGHAKIIISKIDTNQSGVIWVGIYNSEDSYMDNKKNYKGFKILANRVQKIHLLKNLPVGNYAISIFHDANENKLLDTNFIGIPKEGYGFSNNPNSFGVPSFEKVQVSINSAITTEINILLKY